MRAEGDEIVIGAMTTQHEIIGSELLAARAPILREAATQIADPQVRYMGTIGGNVANGDPGNDMPGVMMALGASYVLRGPDGERRVAARDYYQGAYTTAASARRNPDRDPHQGPPAGHGWAYEKLKRKVGDYATAAAAVILTVSGGKIATCAIGLTNVADTALFAKDAAQAVSRNRRSTRRASPRRPPPRRRSRPPPPTAAARPQYRTKMAGVMTARALSRAFARATILREPKCRNPTSA